MPFGPGPVGRVGQPGDRLVDDVHQAGRPAARCAAATRPRREPALEPDEQQVDDDRQQDRRDGAEVDLGREAAPVALEDEEAEAAEAIAQDRRDRDQADRRDLARRTPGDDQRDGERQLDRHRRCVAGVAHAVGGLEDVGRHGVEARRRCCARRSAACTGRAGSRPSGSTRPVIGDERGEEGEAGDRVQDVRDADDRPVGRAPADGDDGQRERDHEADRDRDRASAQMCWTSGRRARRGDRRSRPSRCHRPALAHRARRRFAHALARSCRRSRARGPSPASSTTMPAWTSASSSIDSASLSVVRRSSSGDIGTARSLERPLAGTRPVEPADGRSSSSTSSR